MKGLLIKDAYTMMKETKYFFILAVVMAFFQNDFLFSYIIVYAASLPIAALAYDERAKWDKMAETLPLTVGPIIGSKYIMGYVSVGIAMLLAISGKLLGSSFRAEDMVTMLIVVCIALAVQAFNMPLMFWIGVERGRLLFIALVVGAALAVSSIGQEIMASPVALNINFILFSAVGITIAVNIISFYVSRIAYYKKQR